MKIRVFAATLPLKLLSSGQDNHKYLTLKYFAQGALAAGEDAALTTRPVYEPCDVAMILGWVHDNGKTAPHLQLRQTIIEEQKRRGGHLVIADSNLFLYNDVDNPLNYLRYSFDNVFPDVGTYCDDQPVVQRWDEIKRAMKIEVKPWRNTGEHILVCLQRHGGWSMGAYSTKQWAVQVIKLIRQHSPKRPIVIRAHPGDRHARTMCREILSELTAKGYKNNIISAPDRTLVDDLANAKALVCHNSSPGVAGAVEGVPVFLTDPARSQAREVAHTDFSQLEHPQFFDRTPWLIRLSQFHWCNADLISGRCWQHMRQWIS